MAHLGDNYKIAPVGEHGTRPTWSVMIPTFNSARYLGETLSSVLDQAPPEDKMQIEVVDDCSTDNPKSVVDRIGQGRIKYFRQPKNVGQKRNFETCLNRSKGHIVHLLHGDDAVRLGFYDSLESPLLGAGKIGAAFSRTLFVDDFGNWIKIEPLLQAEAGIFPNLLDLLSTQQRLQTPSMVVKRSVYEKLGGFDEELVCTEDWEMWARIAKHYDVWYEPRPLAIHRRHPDSATSSHNRTAENSRDMLRTVKKISTYLPENKRDTNLKIAMKNVSVAALQRSYKLLDLGDYRAAHSQARQALLASRELKQKIRAAYLLGLTLVKRISNRPN